MTVPLRNERAVEMRTGERRAKDVKSHQSAI